MRVCEKALDVVRTQKMFTSPIRPLREEIMNDSVPIEQTNLFTRKVLLFLLSQNLSLFGSSVVSFAIIWHITLQTSSGTWLMLATLTMLVPQVIVSLWGGVWADRYNRKHLIMLSDGFIALATLILAILYWAGFQNLELLLLVSSVRSLAAGVQGPAVNAIYPQLVSSDGLTRVQGVNQTLGSILALISPAVGGIVLGSFDIAWAFMIDVVTAALAILVFSFIKVERVPRTEEITSVFREFRLGFDYTFSKPILKGIFICYAFSFFLFTPAAVLTPLMVDRSFAGGVWGLTANELLWTFGSLLGGIFVSVKGEFKDKIRTIALCVFAFGVTFGLLGLAGNMIIYLAIMGIAGIFMPIIITAETVLIQEVVEPAMMGRVFSMIQIISASAMPIGIIFFGPLADVVSVELILIVSGGLLALVGIIFWLWTKRLRGLTAEVEENIPPLKAI